MKRAQQDGFVLRAADISNHILIPRYYDPRIQSDLGSLDKDFHLVSLRDLVAAGHVMHVHGDYVPKIYYGTGAYPYVRTSDLANWEIKASPKHGVPLLVYEEFAPDQGVIAGDILFVHEGTYLIGSVGMVTEFDGPLLYQHHLAKFRVNKSCPFNAFYLLAAFESPLVRQQIRSKQFSADIIDSVVGRLEEVVIPYPKDAKRLAEVEEKVEAAVLGRAKLRQKIAYATEQVEFWLKGERVGECAEIFAWEPDPERFREPVFLGGRKGFSASSLPAADIRGDVLLPRYYDPSVNAAVPHFSSKCDVVSVGSLLEQGLLALQTGDEIGRLNYGTGTIPFIRTSDFGSWELKREAKQGVSDAVHREWVTSQDLRAGDVLMVRDGTYLVGTSVLVCEDDLPALYCGGIYKLRSLNHELLPPGLLFALLNLPFVKQQIKNKQFTRDVIDTIGRRVTELLLPVPKDAGVRENIGVFFGRALADRAGFRTKLHKLTEHIFERKAEEIA